MIENERQLENARDQIRLLKETIAANQASWFSREQSFQDVMNLRKSIVEYEKRVRPTKS